MPNDIANVQSSSGSKVVHAVCTHDCPDSCGVLVTVDVGTGRAVKVQGDPAHPVTRGFLCGKVARYLDRVYSPERLLYPMKRRAGVAKGPLAQGREAEAFERISWDEALSLVAGKLERIAAEFGPESVLPYSYAGTIGQLGYGSMDRRFFYRMGASQLDRTICASAGGAALKSVYGVKLGTVPQDFAHAGLVICWGANVHGNNVHLWPFIEEARRKGARLVVIDPYRTRTAALADEHLVIRPGTDGMLALSLMHVIFREGLEDTEYLRDCTVGAEALREHALREEHAPERAAEVTGIAAERIEALARAYAMAGRGLAATHLSDDEAIAKMGHPGAGGPAVIRMNYGIQRSENGGTAARAVAMLPLVTGSWTRRGGGMLLSTSGSFPFNERGLQMPELMEKSALGRAARVVNMSELGLALTELGRGAAGLSAASAKGADFGLDDKVVVGQERTGATAKTEATAGLSAAPSQVREGSGRDDTSLAGGEVPVKALFVYNCNAAAVAPDSEKVLEGLRREDLFTVVHEQFFTDTTDYADVVLPATTFLEAKDVMGAYGHLFAQVSERAIVPLGEARSNVWLFGELGKRMFPGETAFEDGEEELIETALESEHPYFAGVTKERLEREGHVALTLPVDERGETLPFSSAEWFGTASGRGDLVPVPVFVAPVESRSGVEGKGAFPLEFLPRKADNFMNTTFANLAGHQQMERKTAGVLEMHTTDAARRGVATGDAVRVWNGRGRITLTARVGETVGAGVVAARLDWHKLSEDGANVNALTSERLTDMGGGATFYSTLVEVAKV